MKDEIDAFIDSNVLIYQFDEDDEKKNVQAKKLIQNAWDLKVKFGLSLQVLAEFYMASTTKLKRPISKEFAYDRIMSLMSHESWKIFKPSTKSLKIAIEFNIKYKVDFWDAMIAAVMLENGITKIYTENVSDFIKIPGIIPINPFLHIDLFNH